MESKKKECKHEYRQKIIWGLDSPQHGGYYCIYCLKEQDVRIE